VWKSAHGDMREMKREWGSPCYFVMHQPDVVLLCLRFDCCRDVVWWVSVWKSADGDMREMKREWGSPCYFVMHQPDVVLRELRFDSGRDLVWWVSVWKSADGDMREMKREWGSPCYFVMHHEEVDTLGRNTCIVNIDNLYIYGRTKKYIGGAIVRWLNGG
jgi:hypothetical protein